MKTKDHKMLEEAYQQVNEDWTTSGIINRPEAKYVEMADGSTKLDLYNTFDKQALFSYIMRKPQLKNAMTELINKRDTQTFYKWLASLDKEVLSNGNQQAYVQDVFREEVHAKFPQAKKDYEELKRKANERTISNKSTISGLAKQDPREVEGYGRTYGESFDAIDMVKHLGMGDIKKQSQDPLTENLLSLIDNFEKQHGEGKPTIYELGNSVANVIKELYGSHNKIPFLSTVDKAIKS